MARDNFTDHQEDRLDGHHGPDYTEYLTGVPDAMRLSKIRRHYLGQHKNTRPAPGTEAERVYLSGRA